MAIATRKNARIPIHCERSTSLLDASFRSVSIA
jgi:hypothetical protein